MSKLSTSLESIRFGEVPSFPDAENGASSNGKGESATPGANPPNGPGFTPLPAKLTRLGRSDLGPLLPFGDPRSAAAEQYRIIRTKILHHAKRPRLIVVSSASSGDGKTVTSINLAASIALKADRDVLLVDADLRRPRVAEALEIPLAPGLSDVIAGEADLESALLRAEQFPNLYILPAGDSKHNPAELLDSGKWRTLIQRMRSRFDFVILDATPVSVVADYELMQMVSDGVILVVRPDHTNRKECAKVLETVPKEKLLGVVLNGVEETWFWKANSYYRYEKKT